MDRRHRAFLSHGTVAALVGFALMAGKLGAQSTPAQNQNQVQLAPAPSPGGSATPWVQASSPSPSPTATPAQANANANMNAAPSPAKPTPSATPKPTATPPPATPPPSTPKPSATPAAPTSTPKPTAVHTPASATSPTPAPPAVVTDEIKAKMLREREHESNQSQASDQGSLSNEEQTTFQKNARLWNRLLPEEQRAILGQAGERIREETEQAYGQIGLTLNDDQREVFALRYRQERRRLERELQEKANNERNRRMPQILEGLKREFSKPSAANAPKPSPTPVQTPPPSPSAAVNGAGVPKLPSTKI